MTKSGIKDCVNHFNKHSVVQIILLITCRLKPHEARLLACLFSPERSCKLFLSVMKTSHF